MSGRKSSVWFSIGAAPADARAWPSPRRPFPKPEDSPTANGKIALERDHDTADEIPRSANGSEQTQRRRR